MSEYINQKDYTNKDVGLDYKIICGPCCIRMVLLKAKNIGRVDSVPDMEEIIGGIKKLNGFIENVGIKHSSIARYLTNYKLPSYTQEFTLPEKDRSLIPEGVIKIINYVTNGGIVLASVYRNFDETSNQGHFVLIKGVEEEELIIDDPDYETGREDMHIKHEDFARAWRGFAVFVN